MIGFDIVKSLTAHNIWPKHIFITRGNLHLSGQFRKVD